MCSNFSVLGMYANSVVPVFRLAAFQLKLRRMWFGYSHGYNAGKDENCFTRKN